MLCGSSKIEILSSCTILVCCLARSLNARSPRKQLQFSFLGQNFHYGYCYILYIHAYSYYIISYYVYLSYIYLNVLRICQLTGKSSQRCDDCQNQSGKPQLYKVTRSFCHESFDSEICCETGFRICGF